MKVLRYEPESRLRDVDSARVGAAQKRRSNFMTRPLCNGGRRTKPGLCVIRDRKEAGKASHGWTLVHF